MRITIVTYNVHQWVDSNGEDSLYEIISTLKNINADIIGLQEVMYPSKISNQKLQKYKGKPAIEVVAEELGMKYMKFMKEIVHLGEDYGNALLSKYPMECTCQMLGGIAGLIIGDIKIENICIRVGVTHLDPANEKLRVQQALKASNLLFSENQSIPHIFLGDFNALKRADYNDREWKNLEMFNAEQNFQPPKHEVMDLLEHKLGYIDPFSKVGTGKKLTCWTAYPLYRIDYILVSKNFSYKLQSCKRYDSYASDHFPVVFVFETDC
jgi:endonuclease/exonuclease/phosphatase family metal-dependent hydrolase